MTCPPGCTCPESLLSNKSPEKSRYFTGISPAVLFVASLSLLGFLAVVLGAAVFAGIQLIFFFALPLAAAAGGAFLALAPEAVPLGPDPAVQLLLRALGAVAIAYAGGAMLVGRSRCAKARAAYLTLVAASLAAMTAAFTADKSSALAGEVSESAALVLGRMTVAAVVGAILTATGPRVTKKIQSGKPGEPGMLCYG